MAVKGDGIILQDPSFSLFFKDFVSFLKDGEKMHALYPWQNGRNYDLEKMLQTDPPKQSFIWEVNELKQMKGGRKNFPQGKMSLSPAVTGR